MSDEMPHNRPLVIEGGADYYLRLPWFKWDDKWHSLEFQSFRDGRTRMWCDGIAVSLDVIVERAR